MLRISWTSSGRFFESSYLSLGSSKRAFIFQRRYLFCMSISKLPARYLAATSACSSIGKKFVVIENQTIVWIFWFFHRFGVCLNSHDPFTSFSWVKDINGIAVRFGHLIPSNPGTGYIFLYN